MVKQLKLQQTYGLETPLVRNFPLPIIASRAPTTSDKNFTLGQLWVYRTTGAIYGLAAVASGSATWSLLGPGASDVDTLTGDSGGAISPVGGNITLAGGTNITTAGAGSTLTFNLDAAISLATSVTSPLYTAGAGVDVDIEAPANQDVIIKLGDAAGVNKLSITDSADAEVFALDSNGTLTFAGSGGVNVTGADLDVQGGNILISGAAQQLQVEGGAATDFIGQATLVNGQVTVNNTNIAATDRIFLSRSAINASTALGELLYTISAGASFTIEAKDPTTPASDETGDLSTIDYFIVRQL